MRQLELIPSNAEEKIFHIATSLGYNKDVMKARKGNKAACRRVRKELLEIQNNCLTARKELLNIIKS